MENNNYPFIKCLHPLRIVNQYTRQPMVVPCGHCKACLMRKANTASLKCQMESEYTIFTMFVTLTYAPAYLPRMRATYDTDTGNYCFKMVNRFTDSDTLFDGKYTESDISLLRRKFNVGGDIPVLHKPDLQLFLKRFRKFVDKNYHEKVRYYACGEYGPKHYRPHYHLLFFFNSQKVAENFNDILHKTWTFGFVDASLSQGNCASYVAGYVNSHVFIPSVLKAKQICPFSTHSFFLGMARYCSLRPYIYQTTFEDATKYVLPVYGNYNTFKVFSTFTRYYYPKCKGYAIISTSQRYQLYTIYAKVLDVYNTYVCPSEPPSTMDLARFVFALSKSDDAQLMYPCINYFAKEYYTKKLFRDPDEVDKIIRSIYRELAISKHFLTFVCDNNTYGERKKKLNIIEEFYKWSEYQALINNYKKMEDLITDTTIQYLPLFYDDNSDFDFIDSPFYGSFRSQVDDRFNMSIKHKILNDANYIFNSI